MFFNQRNALNLYLLPIIQTLHFARRIELCVEAQCHSLRAIIERSLS